MNVLLLATHLNAGGITSYMYTLSKGFVGKGHSVYVVTSGGDWEARFKEIGVELLNLDIRTKSELSFKIYRALKPLKKYIEDHQIDIIHAQTRITQVMGRLLEDSTATHYVSTCHGFFKPRLSRKIASCWGDKVIAISQPVVEHLQFDFMVDPDDIFLIQSGIDLSKFRVLDMETRQKLREKSLIGGGPLIGVIARLSDVKGQDILVAAMPKILKEFPHAKLVLAGEGRLEALLRKMIKTHNLESSVVFIPKIDDIVEMISILDVFVAPSRNEGLGISIMEAQGCGVPVVAASVGGIPSLVEDGKTGYLFPPKNVPELAQKVIYVLKNIEEAQEVGRNGRVFVERYCSADIMIDKTLQLYSSVQKN